MLDKSVGIIDVGWVIWACIIGGILAIGVISFIIGITMHEKSNNKTCNLDVGFFATGGTAIAIGLVAVLLFAWGFWPAFNPAWHTYYKVSGIVKTIDSRLMQHDTGMSQIYPVTFVSNTNTIYRCDDSRCSAVHPGNYLELRCKHDWEYGNVPGYTCRFWSTNLQTSK